MNPPAQPFSFKIISTWPEEAAEPVYPFVSPVPSAFENSPDPLRGTAFDTDTANCRSTDMLTYALRPVFSQAWPTESFSIGDDGQGIEVRGGGDLRWDFGV